MFTYKTVCFPNKGKYVSIGEKDFSVPKCARGP